MTPKYNIWQFTRNTPLPVRRRGGGARSNKDQFKWTVTSLYPRYHEYLTGGYTSYDFVKEAPHNLHGRISLTSKPPFLTSTDLSVRVCAATHPPLFQYSTDALPPPLTTALKKHRQLASDQVRSYLFISCLLNFYFNIWIYYCIFVICVICIESSWKFWKEKKSVQKSQNMLLSIDSPSDIKCKKQKKNAHLLRKWIDRI